VLVLVSEEGGFGDPNLEDGSDPDPAAAAEEPARDTANTEPTTGR